MEFPKWVMLSLVGTLIIPLVPFLLYILIRSPRVILSILLLGLPIHTIIFRVVRVELNLPANMSLFLQSWKELLILILLISALANFLTTGKYTGPAPMVFVVCILLILSGFIGFFLSPSISAAILGWRGTLEPYIILALMLFFPITNAWLRKITPLLLSMGTLVAVFAIFQSLVLGFSFIQKYYTLDGVIPTSFSFTGGNIQRAMGTFSSPNQLSLYLVFLILIAVNLLLRSNSRSPKVFLAVCSIVMSTALILTVSRSGWAALLTGTGVSFIIWRRKARFIVAAITVLLFTLPTFFIFDLDRHLVNTIQGKEISANYRTELAIDNIRTVLNNPLGVGFGVVGARTQVVRGMNIQTYSTESYLLQLAMELGIIGIVLYSVLIIIIAANLYKNIYRVNTAFARGWTTAALSCLVAALTHAVFIPDLQDLTVATYLSVILAIGLWLPRLEQVHCETSEAQVVANRQRIVV